MEDPQFQETAAASSSGHQQAVDPRTEFNSAYANLEQTIRNFSKEKIQYEQIIEGLNEQVAVIQESIQKLSAENQDVVAENARLLHLHEENEKNRCTFDTLCSAVERKQEIIADSVQGFEKFERDVYNRYEEHEEFLYCLKFRQVQLKKWIDENLAKNRVLEQSLKQKHEEFEARYAALGAQLDETLKKVQEITLEFEAEKSSKAAVQKELEEFQVKRTEELQSFETEKSSLSGKLDELQKKVQEITVEFEAEKSSKAAVQKELEEFQVKRTEELLSFETEKSSLSGKLDELQKKMDQQSTNFKEETAAMEVTFRNEYAKFEKEKEELARTHQETVDNLKEDLDREKNERRQYQKKYLDQKLAISKMVEEVGVRPVILPSGKDAKRRPPVPIISNSSPDRAEAKSSQERQPPKTPMLSRPPPEAMTMTPTRTGILKRHSFSAGDKNQRNVSFGPTFITDFVINSDTDESTASSEIQEKKSDKEVPAGKRMKYSDGKKPQSNAMQVDKDKKEKGQGDPDYKPEKPARRYVRKIAQPKTSDF